MENMGIQKTVMHYQSARGKKGGGGGDAAAPLAALERLLADGGLIFNDAKQDALITSGTGCHTGALCAERPDTLQPVLCSSRSRSLRCDSAFSLGHRDGGGGGADAPFLKMFATWKLGNVPPKAETLRWREPIRPQGSSERRSLTV